MRTLELPDEFVELAEAEARRRGMSVEDLVVSTVSPTLIHERPERGGRVKFPIIDSGLPGTLNMTPEMIRQVEFEDDMRRSGLLGYE